MTDNLSTADRKKTMRAVKGKDTSLERRASAMIAGMHLSGWKKNDLSVTGKPDITFPSLRVAVFLDGCFWHGCLDCGRSMPKSNQEYWERKVQRNRDRDAMINASLMAEGWLVVRFWEHELQHPDMRAAARQRLRSAIAAQLLRKNDTERPT